MHGSLAAAMAEAVEPAAPDVVRLNNKWDPSEVKRVLDECASQVRICLAIATGALRLLAWQAVLDAGYEEDMFISNTKIGPRAVTARRPLRSR